MTEHGNSFFLAPCEMLTFGVDKCTRDFLAEFKDFLDLVKNFLPLFCNICNSYLPLDAYPLTLGPLLA